jgi:hypothetical protein
MMEYFPALAKVSVAKRAKERSVVLGINRAKEGYNRDVNSTTELIRR